MSRVVVPIHLGNLAAIPTGTDIGFKQLYLRTDWVKLYNGVSEQDLVLDRPLDNFTPTTGSITAADTVLTALEKLQYSISLLANSVSEAPNDGSQYVRKNEAWNKLTTYATSDPSITDNVSAGYPLGNDWFNTNTGEKFYQKANGIWVSYNSNTPGGDDSPVMFADYATTTDLIIPYDNGIGGVGATLTSVTNGTLFIDGFTVQLGETVLVKDQPVFVPIEETNISYQNGVYVLTQAGGPGEPFILTRANFADESAELYPSQVNVLKGLTNKDRFFLQKTENPVIGVSDIIYEINYVPPTQVVLLPVIHVDTATSDPLPECVQETLYLTGTVNGNLGVINGVDMAILLTSVANRKILVKNQVNASQNGDYDVVQIGSTSQPWKLRRITNSSGGFNKNNREWKVNNEDSILYGNRYYMNNVTFPFIVGTTNITFSELTPGAIQSLQDVTDVGNTTDNNIQFGAAAGVYMNNGSRLKEGTIDAGYGGSKGIAQICAVGYELKWEAGRLYVMGDGGTTIREVSHNFTSIPTIYDDISKGFVVESRWLLDDGTLYLCTDNTVDAAVWELQVIGTQDLQSVTDIGNTTDNNIIVENIAYTSTIMPGDIVTQELSTNKYSFLSADGIIGMGNGSQESKFKNTNVTNPNVILEFPNKSTGSYTIATTDDITSGTVTSVGLTMPSAFTVTNSPITSSGDIAVTGAGLASQYVRGDGSLASFPDVAGGGGGQVFYFNGGTSQGTIGGNAFKQLSAAAVLGTGVDFTSTSVDDVVFANFITDVGKPTQEIVPAGVWVFQCYLSASSTSTCEVYITIEVYDGSTFTVLATSLHERLTNSSTIDLYTFTCAVPEFNPLIPADRIAIRFYATNLSGSRTITLHTQDSHLSSVQTTFTTGLASLDGLTAAAQYLQVGTTGTDFNINTSGTDTHKFNLPTASATNRGALSSADWSTFNGKQDALSSGVNIKTINGVSVLGSGDINTTGTSGNQLLTGGASWSGTGMVYNVTTLTYIIDGANYGPTTPANVTLANGDPSFSRFDAIVVDVTGVPSVITGTPSSNPTTPTVSEDFVLIQYVLVGQAATTPTITNEFVYREGSSPDWTSAVLTGTAPLLSASFVSTTPTPFQGSQCTLVTAPSYVGSKYIQYTKPSGSILRSTYSFLTFRVNLPVALPTRNVLVYLYNGTTLIGAAYATNWGLDLSTANTWQLVSIPTSIFGSASITTITRVIFRFTGVALNTFSAGYDQFAFDDVKFQSGYGPQANTANITVDTNNVTIGDTSKLNFIDGTNTNVVSTYDTLNNKVDVRVNAKGITQVTSVTLATVSWSLVSGLWQYVYSNAAITATSIVDVIPANASIAIVKAADVLPATSSASGTVTLYATNAPSSTISVTVNIYN